MQQLQQKTGSGNNKYDDLYQLEQKIKIMREHIKNHQEGEKDNQANRENHRY